MMGKFVYVKLSKELNKITKEYKFKNKKEVYNKIERFLRNLGFKKIEEVTNKEVIMFHPNFSMLNDDVRKKLFLKVIQAMKEKIDTVTFPNVDFGVWYNEYFDIIVYVTYTKLQDIETGEFIDSFIVFGLNDYFEAEINNIFKFVERSLGDLDERIESDG